ncbi:MAG: AbrB family transcriptional regulator, partial [Acidaminococcaceae bacterium]|nr:AbrB family transcriptional regulator [Acidaminococcaceae bacterium]
IKTLLFLLSAILGWGLHFIGMPIPWMLGGVFVSLGLKISGIKGVKWPRMWRNYGLIVVGYGIGRYVTPMVLDQMLHQIPGIAGATLIAVMAALLISILMSKYEKIDLHSTIMGIMPGGFTQMTAMIDEDSRVDANIVTVLQSLRLITIVVSVPFLVTHFLGAEVTKTATSLAVTNAVSFWLILPFAGVTGLIMEKLKISTPYLLGPIILAALAALYTGLLNTAPNWLLATAQLSIGIYVGSGLEPQKVKKLARVMPSAFLGIFSILGISIVVAYVLSYYYGFSLITAFLAMAPGGLGEMCLVGMSLEENVAIILTYQMFRFLFLNLAVPFGIYKYFGKPLSLPSGKKI